MWVGIPPSPQVFAQLDPEATAVLALLTWSFGTNRPVTASQLAALPDRNGQPLGVLEAKRIVRELSDLRIASVRGMNNDLPLRVFLGGFQPASARRAAEARPAPQGRPVPAPTGAPVFQRPAPPVGRQPRVRRRYERAKPELVKNPPKSGYEGPMSRPKQMIEKRADGLPYLRTTENSPQFVLREARHLRARQLAVESAGRSDDLVKAATERLRILTDRIGLYERWLAAEPAHWVLAEHLARKRKAVPELEYQLERAKVKQAERETENA